MDPDPRIAPLGRLVRATAANLPPGVASALAESVAGRELRVDADDTPWRAIEWGDASNPPLLLVHGVTSNAESFWRVGPAVAAAGRHVVAVDLPGHGRTGAWRGRHRFAETAADLVGFIQAAGLDRPDLVVLGHSWGSMVAAALPGAGLQLARIVLLDPPAIPLEALRQITVDPTERPYEHLADATAVIRRLYPAWTEGDVHAKALGLTQFNADAVLAVMLENGAWDAGLAALADPAARDVAVWLIRGEVESGGLTPDAALPALAARIGADHILTIAGGAHSPQRMHPEATVLAILTALGTAPD